MAADGSIPLRTFVYRTLAFRLALVALAVALVFAMGVHLRQRGIFERQVADLVRTEHALLIARAERIASTRGIGMVEAVPIALSERLNVSPDRVAGRFVYMRIFSPELAQPLEASDGDSVLVSAAKAALPVQPPDRPVSEVETDMTKVNGKPFVRVLAPFSDLRDGYLELVFSLSDQAMVRARNASLTATAIAVGIVLVTAALLYPVILRLVRRLADLSESLLEANFAAVSLLGAAIALRDSDTDAHNFRVTIYSLRLGEAIGLPPAQMRALMKGAFLHDVGKIGIQDDILLKPGRLSDEEFAVMRTHVEQGVDLVRRSPWLADAAAVVGSHHEKVDGSGYPKGVKGAEIPITARVFAIVDVFDALTSRRPYKEPLTLEASVAILEQGRGAHFDPALLEAFLKIAPELYRRYAGREDEDIKREVQEAARRHFKAGLDTLAY